MKTATTTTSIIVQRREEDQDCDAKEKKINDTVLFLYSPPEERCMTILKTAARETSQPANADVFPVVASILSIRKVTFRERSDDRKYLYSRGFLCAKPRCFANCSAVFFFLSFLFWGSVKFPSRRVAIGRVL